MCILKKIKEILQEEKVLVSNKNCKNYKNKDRPLRQAYFSNTGREHYVAAMCRVLH